MRNLIIYFLLFICTCNLSVAQSIQYNFPRDKSFWTGPIKTTQSYQPKKISLDTAQIHGNIEVNQPIYNIQEFTQSGALALSTSFFETTSCEKTIYLHDEHDNLIYRILAPCFHPFVIDQDSALEIALKMDSPDSTAIKQTTNLDSISISSYKYDMDLRKLNIYPRIESNLKDRSSPSQILTFNEKSQVTKSEWFSLDKNGNPLKSFLNKIYKDGLLSETQFESELRKNTKSIIYDNQKRKLLEKTIYDPVKKQERNPLVAEVYFDYGTKNSITTRVYHDGVEHNSSKELIFQKQEGKELPVFKGRAEIDPDVSAIYYKDEEGNTYKTYRLPKLHSLPLSVTNIQIEYYQ